VSKGKVSAAAKVIGGGSKDQRFSLSNKFNYRKMNKLGGSWRRLSGEKTPLYLFLELGKPRKKNLDGLNLDVKFVTKTFGQKSFPTRPTNLEIGQNWRL